MSNTTKRQKTVFTSNELAHIWAHQRAPEGRCPGHHSFRGKTCYSYATPIARLLDGAANGGVVVVFNATSYSPTTGQHQSKVRRATGHMEMFYVCGFGMGEYNGLPSTPKSLRDHYLSEFDSYNSQELESRYAHVRARSFISKVQYLDQAIRVCEVFGLASKALKTKRAKLQPKITEADEILEKKDQRKRELEATRTQRHREAAIRNAQRWVEDPADTRIINVNVFITQEPELAAKCEAKNNQLLATKIQRWKAGDKNVNLRFDYDYQGIIMLRQEGEEIVTTMGARFPVEHGKKAFAMVLKCRLRGQGFTNNGHSIRVGHYTIDRIDSDGTVHAGCHHIQYEELTSLAVRMKWMDESHQPIDQEIREIACTP